MVSILFSAVEYAIQKNSPLQYRPRVVDDSCAPTVPFANTLLKFYRVMLVFSTNCVVLGSLTTTAMCTAWLSNSFCGFVLVTTALL